MVSVVILKGSTYNWSFTLGKLRSMEDVTDLEALAESESLVINLAFSVFLFIYLEFLFRPSIYVLKKIK